MMDEIVAVVTEDGETMMLDEMTREELIEMVNRLNCEIDALRRQHSRDLDFLAEGR